MYKVKFNTSLRNDQHKNIFHLFQIIPLSESLMLAMSFHSAFIFSIPSLITGPVLKTAAWVCNVIGQINIILNSHWSIVTCIVFCILSLMAAVLTSPSAYLSLSMLATEASPALSDKGPIASPGLESSAIVLAHARPKMTRSRRLFAPSLLAPCTELQPASPAA